jgi:hypothetical protein
MHATLEYQAHRGVVELIPRIAQQVLERKPENESRLEIQNGTDGRDRNEPWPFATVRCSRWFALG